MQASNIATIRQLLKVDSQDDVYDHVYNARVAAAEIVKSEFPTEEELRRIYSYAAAMLDNYEKVERQLAAMTILSLCDFYLDVIPNGNAGGG